MAEVEERYKPQLDELARQIRDAPSNQALYAKRANLYVMMFRSLLLHRPAGVPFIEKALADYSAAINLRPTVESYLGRAWCSQEIIWMVRHPRSDQTKEAVDFFLNDPVLAQAFSDFRDAARLSTDREEQVQSFAGLAQLHLWRAKTLATPAAMAELGARGAAGFVWSEFERSLEYARELAKRTPEKILEWPTFREERMGGVYAEIGYSALRLGEYGRALAAFQSGEKYLTNHYTGICAYHGAWGDTFGKKGRWTEAIETYSKGIALSEWNCRFLLERRGDALFAQGKFNLALADYTALLEGDEKFPACMTVPFCNGRLPIKRAKAYLRLEQPEKAVAQISLAVEKAYLHHCREVFLLRAEGYRLLGNLQQALADEQRAAKLPPSTACVLYYIEGLDSVN